jgi:hypothetical protein
MFMFSFVAAFVVVVVVVAAFVAVVAVVAVVIHRISSRVLVPVSTLPYLCDCDKCHKR